MRVVFMGTPGLAANVLEELCEHHDVVGVFTRPDAVRGRGKKLVGSPVKEVAVSRGIPVYTPSTFADDETRQLVESIAPDCICVVAYGCILPQAILDIPKYGCLNVHTSLLPRWRGAAPIERAILAGDEQTGVCIMKMEAGLDTGPYCTRRTVPVDTRYVGDLAEALSREGADALVESLDALEHGDIAWTPQGDDGLTYADKIGKGELDFGPEDDVAEIDAKVRASNDSHPSRAQVAGRRIAVLRAHAVQPGEPCAAAELPQGKAALVAKRLVVAASDGLVELEKVKPDGKAVMEGRAFAAGIQGIKNMQVEWGRA